VLRSSIHAQFFFMRRAAFFFTIILTCAFTALRAQYNLHIQVNDFSGKPTLYVAGSFNNWNPADKNYQLKRVNYFRTEITIRNLPKGRYIFKLTRGSLRSVESTVEGKDIPNRVVDLQGDTTVLYSVQGWKDADRNPAHINDSIRMRNAISGGFTFLNINLDSSYKYALETFVLAPKVQDNQLKAYAINLQGEVLIRLGNTEKALELYGEGLRIRKAMSDSGAIMFLYIQIGNAYWQMKDTIQAVKNYRAALPWVQPLLNMHPLHEVLCNLYCNIGRSFLERNQLDSAKWYAAKAGQVGDKISTFVNLFLGDIERHQHNPEKAIQYYRSAVDLGLHHDHNMDLVLRSYEQIADLFQSAGQPDSAIVYSRKAFNTAVSLHNTGALDKAGLLLSQLFKQQKLYDSAFVYQQKVIESAQSQFNQQRERQALNTYFNEKMGEQELVAQKKQYQFTLWVYALLAGLGLLSSFAIWYRLRIKSGYNKKMKEVEMRALRAQMNPHFIFNCLGSINRYIVKSDTKTASNYLTKFSKLIRLILDNSSSDHISLEAEIQTLQLYLDMESLRFDHAFEYEIQKDDNVDECSLQLPSMLIQPYVENAIWHGLLQKEERGKLWIRFKKINGHLLQVEIEDNGIGRKKASVLKSKELVKQKSYGMQISSDRIAIINHLYRLKNSVSIYDLTDADSNAAGTKIVVQIPVI
jgi:tetratricopeptide (TPR) repeat protein